MAKKLIQRIQAACADAQFVRFEQVFEVGFNHGYVLDVGKEFFFFATVADSMRFDGFQCVRMKDVRKFREDPHAEFAVAALRARKESIARKPKVTLGSVAEILMSINKISSLVTIHRHKVKPDSCWIGRVIEVSDRELSLLEIGPDAKWDEKPTKYWLKDITEIEFGGGYEEALLLVGGKAPKLKAKA
jgi:hypothetical protein